MARNEVLAGVQKFPGRNAGRFIMEVSQKAVSGEPTFPIKRLICVTAVVIAGVVTALLIPMPFHGRATNAIGDLAHAPLFGSLALAWLWTWGRLRPVGLRPADADANAISGNAANGLALLTIHQGRHLVVRAAVVWVVLSGFGVGMEIAQSGVGRSMSRHDAVANSMGIAAAIAAYVAVWFFLHGRRRAAGLFFLGAVTILLLAWVRPVKLLADVVSMHRRFPLVATFESESEMSRWYLARVDARRVRAGATEGSWSLEVDFRSDKRPVFTMHEMIRDWSAYDAVEMDVSIPADHVCASEEFFIAMIDLQRKLVFTQTQTAKRGQTTHLRFEIPGGSQRLAGHAAQFFDVGLTRCETAKRIRFDNITLTCQDR
ncbi:MAG: hypothetical protein AAGJ83_05890 [Planctomycetota bacterium]